MNPQTSALKVAGEKHMSFPVWDLEPARTPLKVRQVRAPPPGGGGEGLSSCHQQALCAALPHHACLAALCRRQLPPKHLHCDLGVGEETHVSTGIHQDFSKVSRCTVQKGTG